MLSASTSRCFATLQAQLSEITHEDCTYLKFEQIQQTGNGQADPLLISMGIEHSELAATAFICLCKCCDCFMKTDITSIQPEGHDGSDWMVDFQGQPVRLTDIAITEEAPPHFPNIFPQHDAFNVSRKDNTSPQKSFSFTRYMLTQKGKCIMDTRSNAWWYPTFLANLGGTLSVPQEIGDPEVYYDGPFSVMDDVCAVQPCDCKGKPIGVYQCKVDGRDVNISNIQLHWPKRNESLRGIGQPVEFIVSLILSEQTVQGDHLLSPVV